MGLRIRFTGKTNQSRLKKSHQNNFLSAFAVPSLFLCG
jgi:hypothetical protein